MTARQKCIELAKKLAKARDGYVCQRCGKASGQVKIDGAHIVPVSAGGMLPADLENIITLCAGCHTLRSDSWHEDPNFTARWFEEKFPGKYDYLKSKLTATSIKKWQWEQRLLELKALVKGI